MLKLNSLTFKLKQESDTQEVTLNYTSLQHVMVLCHPAQL